MKLLRNLLPLLLLTIGGIAWYSYHEYNRGHESIQTKKPDYTIKALQLFQEFNADEASANNQYLDKLIEVSGKIAVVEADDKGGVSLMLDVNDDMANITCQMDETSKESSRNLKAGDQVKVKGLCAGILMDVILNRCVLVQ